MSTGYLSLKCLEKLFNAFRNVLLDCRSRYLKFICNFTILQSFETAHQKDFPRTLGQLPDDKVDLFLQLSYSSLCSASSVKSA